MRRVGPFASGEIGRDSLSHGGFGLGGAFAVQVIRVGHGLHAKMMPILNRSGPTTLYARHAVSGWAHAGHDADRAPLHWPGGPTTWRSRSPMRRATGGAM